MSIALSVAIASTDTSLLVSSIMEGLVGGGTIQIESEQMSYSYASANQLFGLVRGINSTSAASHAIGTAITFLTTNTETINLNGNRIINVADPIADQDAATKEYVDDLDDAEVPSARLVSTTAPLTGGGDLSADRTIAIPAATNSVNGYLTSADHTTFAATSAAVPGLNVIKIVSADPMTPTEGQVWYNSTSHLLKFYDGTTTQTVAHV